MRLLADVHISPRTVAHLRTLGHDVVRVNDVMAPTATDREIVEVAIRNGRVILTQDLDFSAIIAVSGRAEPSAIALRLASSRVENVNDRLTRVLPAIEHDVAGGALVTVEDARVRVRRLPVS